MDEKLYVVLEVTRESVTCDEGCCSSRGERIVGLTPLDPATVVELTPPPPSERRGSLQKWGQVFNGQICQTFAEDELMVIPVGPLGPPHG